MHTAHPDSLRAEAERLHRAGHSVRDVARRIGASKSTVQRWLRPLRLAEIHQAVRLAMPIVCREYDRRAAATRAASQARDWDAAADALDAEVAAVQALAELQIALSHLDRML